MSKSSGDSETSGSEASPLGKSRYGRTRKPKISEDFCHIDDLFDDGKPQKTVKKTIASPVITTAAAAKTVEIDSLFMPKQIQPLPKQTTTTTTPPQMDSLNVDLPKMVSVPLKERKFFKSNSEVSSSGGGGGEGVDVNEVLKIIKSDHTESPLDNPKPTVKPTLRTYGNKRKLITQKELVESFALPDNPIVPAEIDSNNLQTTVEDEELPTNSIDLKENDVSNCTLKLNYNVVFDEICIKADECMLKGTSVKKLHDEGGGEAGKSDEKIEIKEEVKEKKRKKSSLNLSDVKEVVHVNKKTKVSESVLEDEKTAKAVEKSVVVTENAPPKRKRGRPRKYPIKESTNNVALEANKTVNDSTIREEEKVETKIEKTDQTPNETSTTKINTPLKQKKELTLQELKDRLKNAALAKKLKTAEKSNASQEKQLRNRKETASPARKLLRNRKTEYHNESPEKQLKNRKTDLNETPEKLLRSRSEEHAKSLNESPEKLLRNRKIVASEDSTKNVSESSEKLPINNVKNLNKSPEKQLRSRKSVATEENVTNLNVKNEKASSTDENVKNLRTPPLEKSSRKTSIEKPLKNQTENDDNNIKFDELLEKQLKKEKISDESAGKGEQKSLKKRKLKSSEFVSPRLLRSSVIVVESKPEVVDLTGNDADGENSEEEKLTLKPKKEKHQQNDKEKMGKSGKIVKREDVESEGNLTESDDGVDFKKVEESDGNMKVKEEPMEGMSGVSKDPQGSYGLGDLIWARIGNYPYWPAMVCYEPDTVIFKRDRTMVRFGNISIYHVRFFGDKGRRAWVYSHCLIPFTDKNDFDALAKNASFTNKSSYIIPQAKKLKWETAIKEALSVQNKTVDERNDFFFEMFATKREKKLRLKGIAETMRVKAKIKKEIITPPRKPRIYKKRRNSSQIVSKLIKPDLTASDSSLSDTDTSSKFSVNSTNSLKAQAALYKRNNIFKGAYKGRVCEICEKQDDVLKCNGCFGYFHASCGQKLAGKGREVPKKNSDDSNKEDVLSDDSSNGSDVSSSKVGESSSKAEVSSSKVDMKRLSLAEQIDMKMKEIMKKFDYKSVYADSTSDDSGSSEDSVTGKTKEFSKPDVPEKKIIQHVTADCITFAELENDTKKPEEPPPPPEPIEEIKTETTASMCSIEEIPDEKTFKCFYCRRNEIAPCFICNKSTDGRKKCSLNRCGKIYHIECLTAWPQTRTPSNDAFICPQHVCHTCVSDDPRGACSRHPKDNLVRCIKCPSTYHSTSYCIPAGTIILSAKQVVCVRHVESTKFNKTVNTTWCFLCALGGDLVCCETCPTSVHPKCLKIELNGIEKYICDDCESGRYPLYDEIVWVKLGKYRWWPAVILFPNEVPDKVNNMPHTQGEFVVKFYGTHDHHWVSRGRVFLFEDGDEDHMGKATKKMDLIFRKAVEEAIAAFQLKQSFKTAKAAEMRTHLQPPPYKKIKYNKPVGNVRQFDGNTSNATACECDANEPFPCGPDSDCLNRLLLTECDPTVCPAGDRCNNQRFEKREYPPLKPYKTQGRGWGLKTLAPIKKGQFVVEYVGELIDDQEYQRRIQKMHEQKEENYYFLTIDNNRTIDAGPKGNMARFMNHSCQPNCETQKWTVNGDTRVGLFATEDIAAGAELTFNYNLECVGKEKKICKCGAPNCSGFIGVKAKNNNQEEVQKKPKRLLRKKKSPPPSEPTETEINYCFVCNKPDDVMGCHNKVCNNYYHLECVALREWPDGKWICPWHNCNICAKRTIRCCVKCLNSYCPEHSEGYIRHDRALGFVCFEHDPAKESLSQTILPKQPETAANSTVETHETDITSTSDNMNDDIEEEPQNTQDQQDNVVAGDFQDLPSSTPLKKRRESTVDSDVAPQTSAVLVEKKKRGRKKKIRGRKMKQEVKVMPVRAAKSLVNNSLTIENEVKLTSTVPTRHLRATKRASETCLNEFEKFLKRQQLDFENNLPIRKRSRARCETSL